MIICSGEITFSVWIIHPHRILFVRCSLHKEWLRRNILAPAGQATRGALQTRGLAFAVGVGQYLAEGVVGKGFCRAIRVVDTQHFTIGLPALLADQIKCVAVTGHDLLNCRTQ